MKGSARPSNGDPLVGLRRRRDVSLRQIGLDVALFDPATDRVHLLNAVAAAAWRHITPDRSFKNVVEALQLSFPRRKPAAIARDLRSLVRTLKGKRMLVPAGTKPPKRRKGGRVIPLPDRAISPLERGYQAPSVKTFTIPQLERIFDVDAGRMMPFSDTWNGSSESRVISVERTRRR